MYRHGTVYRILPYCFNPFGVHGRLLCLTFYVLHLLAFILVKFIQCCGVCNLPWGHPGSEPKYVACG